MSEFNYKDYISNNPLLNEALEFMGTADEETMKYLNSLGKDKLVALEKQFVDMFDTLRDIRYDGSEQLSKGASEISQRIHNFVTIIRQVRKGNPVIKEETIKEDIVDDYADRMVGAGLDLKGTLQLVDYYINNPEEIPEPMDKDLFVAHGDKIADATKQLYLRVYEGQ